MADADCIFDLELLYPEIAVFKGTSSGFKKFHNQMAEIVIQEHKNFDYSLKPKSYSFPLASKDPIFENLYSAALTAMAKIHKLVFKKDLVVAENNRKTCWAFVTDAQRHSVSYWHNHVSTCTYNSVYYLRAAEGDSIFLKIPLDQKNHEEGKTIEVPIHEGMIVIMPNWLFHKPKPIEAGRSVERIAINMEVRAVENSFE